MAKREINIYRFKHKRKNYMLVRSALFHETKTKNSVSLTKVTDSALIKEIQEAQEKKLKSK